MKTQITLFIAIFFSMTLMAGNPKNHPDKYCAKLKDGKKTIMHEGTAITSEVTLNNGARIQLDGTIIKSDGSTTMLQEGECISKDGVIATEMHKKNKTK